jgi:hypothetical protein
VDLLCLTYIISHNGRWRDVGGYKQQVSSAHSIGCVQELDVRNICCPPGGCGQVNLAFRTALSDRPSSGSGMSANAALEQKNIVGFGDRLALRFCRSLFGTTRKNIS